MGQDLSAVNCQGSHVITQTDHIQPKIQNDNLENKQKRFNSSPKNYERIKSYNPDEEAEPEEDKKIANNEQTTIQYVEEYNNQSGGNETLGGVQNSKTIDGYNHNYENPSSQSRDVIMRRLLNSGNNNSIPEKTKGLSLQDQDKLVKSLLEKGEKIKERNNNLKSKFINKEQMQCTFQPILNKSSVDFNSGIAQYEGQQGRSISNHHSPPQKLKPNCLQQKQSPISESLRKSQEKSYALQQFEQQKQLIQVKQQKSRSQLQSSEQKMGQVEEQNHLKSRNNPKNQQTRDNHKKVVGQTNNRDKSSNREEEVQAQKILFQLNEDLRNTPTGEWEIPQQIPQDGFNSDTNNKIISQQVKRVELPSQNTFTGNSVHSNYVLNSTHHQQQVKPQDYQSQYIFKFSNNIGNTNYHPLTPRSPQSEEVISNSCDNNRNTINNAFIHISNVKKVNNGEKSYNGEFQEKNHPQVQCNLNSELFYPQMKINKNNISQQQQNPESNQLNLTPQRTRTWKQFLEDQNKFSNNKQQKVQEVNIYKPQNQFIHFVTTKSKGKQLKKPKH